MIHRYYAPVQLLTLSPILYLTVQKGTSSSAGPLKVRGLIWSNQPKTGPDSNFSDVFCLNCNFVIDAAVKLLASGSSLKYEVSAVTMVAHKIF